MKLTKAIEKVKKKHAEEEAGEARASAPREAEIPMKKRTPPQSPRENDVFTGWPASSDAPGGAGGEPGVIEAPGKTGVAGTGML